VLELDSEDDTLAAPLESDMKSASSVVSYAGGGESIPGEGAPLTTCKTRLGGVTALACGVGKSATETEDDVLDRE